jgi:hypothetical protein
VARQRYSRAEAQAEATRRAAEFVSGRPDRDEWRHSGTIPDSLSPPSQACKHPMGWVAVYAPIPPDGGVMDGGELFVAVDLESGVVAVRRF